MAYMYGMAVHAVARNAPNRVIIVTSSHRHIEASLIFLVFFRFCFLPHSSFSHSATPHTPAHTSQCTSQPLRPSTAYFFSNGNAAGHPS